MVPCHWRKGGPITLAGDTGGPVGLGGPVGANEGETRHQTCLVSDKSAKKSGTRRQTRHQTRHLRCIVVPMIRTRCRLRPALQGLPRAHQTARPRGRRTLHAGLTLDEVHQPRRPHPPWVWELLRCSGVGQVDLVVKARRLVARRRPVPQPQRRPCQRAGGPRRQRSVRTHPVRPVCRRRAVPVPWRKRSRAD